MENIKLTMLSLKTKHWPQWTDQGLLVHKVLVREDQDDEWWKPDDGEIDKML